MSRDLRNDFNADTTSNWSLATARHSAVLAELAMLEAQIDDLRIAVAALAHRLERLRTEGT